MIRIIRMNIENNAKTQMKRLTFVLKTSRNIWLAENQLVLKYPERFSELENIGEAVVFSLLPIAYREDSDIELPANLPIEKGTQDRIDKICALWNSWFSCNRRVKIFADTTLPSFYYDKERFNAQLFSGGVDSLATFKRQRDKIRYLVLYNGADVPVSRPERFREVNNYMGKFAQEQNKELITLSTNVHYLGVASWEHMAHCCAMVGPLLALSHYINRIYIGATFSGAYRIPWGSRPDLDPLVRIESIETIHDGFELKRSEKIALLATDPVLLKRLRVCGSNITDSYNCGKCEKCYRTTTILALLGISPGETHFPKEAFSLHNISQFLKMGNLEKEANFLKFLWSQNLEFLELSSTNVEKGEELKSTLRTILGNFYEEYKKGFPKLPREYISKWRKLERQVGLPMDSLKWVRGSSYKKFLKNIEKLQFNKG